MANAYGDSGNRWWVGLNVESDQSLNLGIGSILSFGIGSPLSPNGYESLPSGNATDDALFAGAAGANAVANAAGGTPNTISVENVNWFNINGPYTTQAQANAAIPAIQKANPAPGEFQQATAGGQGNAANGGGINSNWEQALANVGNALTNIGNTLTNVGNALTDANLWIRAAKMVLGGALIIVGVSKMTGVSNVITQAAEKIPVVPL